MDVWELLRSVRTRYMGMSHRAPAGDGPIFPPLGTFPRQTRGARKMCLSPLAPASGRLAAAGLCRLCFSVTRQIVGNRLC